MPNHFAYRFGGMPHHKHPFVRPPLVCHPGIYPPICFPLVPGIVPPVVPLPPVLPLPVPIRPRPPFHHGPGHRPPRPPRPPGRRR